MADQDNTTQLIQELKHLADSCCSGSNFTPEHCIAGRAAVELELMTAELVRVKAELSSVKEAYGVK